LGLSPYALGQVVKTAEYVDMKGIDSSNSTNRSLLKVHGYGGRIRLKSQIVATILDGNNERLIC